MRTAIDDCPHLSVSRLRAAGLIRADDKTTVIAFPPTPDTDPPTAPTFVVAVTHIHFPNGGGWSFFQCPCGRRVRTIRLHRGSLACKHCLEAKGFRYRVEDLSRPERAAHVAARLAARLAAAEAGAHARLKPHLRYSALERRGRLVAALRRAEYVAYRRDFRDLIPKAKAGGD